MDQYLLRVLLDNEGYFYESSVLNQYVSDLRIQRNWANFIDATELRQLTKIKSSADVISGIELQIIDQLMVTPMDVIKMSIEKENEVKIAQIRNLGDYKFLIHNSYARSIFINKLEAEANMHSKMDYDIFYEESINNQILKNSIITKINEIKMLNINYNKSKESLNFKMNNTRVEAEGVYESKYNFYRDLLIIDERPHK